MEVKEMRKVEMVNKIKEVLQDIVNQTEKFRNMHLRDMYVKLKNSEAGTVDTFFIIHKFLYEEDDLRKIKNNLREWPKTADFICTRIENLFDRSLYDIDYEIRDSYSFWVSIGNSKAICVELVRAGTDPEDFKCDFKWGIVDKKRSKYVDKFVAETPASVSDLSTIDRMLNIIFRECKSAKISRGE